MIKIVCINPFSFNKRIGIAKSIFILHIKDAIYDAEITNDKVIGGSMRIIPQYKIFISEKSWYKVPKEHFITLAEHRGQKIDEILND